MLKRINFLELKLFFNISGGYKCNIPNAIVNHPAIRNKVLGIVFVISVPNSRVTISCTKDGKNEATSKINPTKHNANGT